MSDCETGPAETAPRAAPGQTAKPAEASEARMVRAGRELFLAKGYGATSLNEIARAARVSKATLYARFPSKADLLRAVIDEQVQRAGVRIRDDGPRPDTLEAMLRRFAERVLQDSLTPETLELNRLIYSHAEEVPDLGGPLRTRAQVGVQYVEELILEYAARENAPCRDPGPPARLFTTLLRGFFDDAMLRGRAASVAEISDWTDRMLAVFLAGRSGW